MDTLIVIPARMASTRLPEKMLADIQDKPLIVHTLESVVSAGCADVIVACDCEEISGVIKDASGVAVLTDPELKSGTDRVYAAYKSFDKNNKYKFIINVQGDMPFIAKEFIQDAVNIIRKRVYDISTVCSLIKDNSYLNENVVKPVIAFKGDDNDVGRALYFSRSTIPFGGPYYHHVGIYGFNVESLEKFQSLPQSGLEKKERLEQLRALENDMTIGIKISSAETPISVDVAEDLENARNYCKNFR
jgi:3-deoxy-manno-octulosonate cytidylyltransferase (CMP-KDO synthetase)